MTKRQREALAWLLKVYGDAPFPSNALMALYEERAAAEHEGEGLAYGYHAGTNRRHAWRRTSGRLMYRLHGQGWLTTAGRSGHYPTYRLSDAARRALA